MHNLSSPVFLLFRTQISDIRHDLSTFLQAGIEKRQRWGSSFHYLVFPFDIFRFIFDMPRDSCKYNVHIGPEKEINSPTEAAY